MFKSNKNAKLSTTLAALVLASAAQAATTTPDYRVQIPQQPVNTESLMLWAEQTYPQFFAGHPKTVTVPASGTTPSVAYRYYPQTGNYLAVSPADVTTQTYEVRAVDVTAPAPGAKVYVLGAATQNQAVAVGVPEDFNCAVYPGRCVTNTYAPGSLRDWYFEEINDVRLRMGMGALQQDTRLDTAATNHAMSHQYVFNPVSAHQETPGTQYFTGVTAEDRATAAGYPVTTATSTNWVGEVIATGSERYPVAAQELLNTVYHRVGLLSYYWTHIGIGTSDAIGKATVMNPACLTTCATVPEGWMATYPMDGQQNIPVTMGGTDGHNEIPDPAPEFAVIGSPVSIHIKPLAENEFISETIKGVIGYGNSIGLGFTGSGGRWYKSVNKEPFAVTSFTLTAPDGTVAPGKVMNQAIDGMLGLGNIFFLPSVALSKNTTYTVRFVGNEMSCKNFVQTAINKMTCDDVVLRTIDKTWTFTTGSI